MSDAIRKQAESVLAGFQDPYLGCDLVSARTVREVTVEEGRVRVRLGLGYPAGDWAPELERRLAEELRALPGAAGAEVQAEIEIVPHVVQRGTKRLAEVKNVIAVASGKGGVGKSTLAVNLALALQADGARVGILDADIYGPSQPRMLGCHGRPDTVDGKSLAPLVSYRLQSMSIGYLVDEETPTIWRGPMVSSALQQLLNDTAWEGLDYLVIDLPPGTGDIQLTMAQKIPVSGSIIVTTPQDIALLDARKALKMFEKVKVTVLGIVENMSVYVCPRCGHEARLFGEGGGERIARQYDAALLGSVPLDPAVRDGADNGRPTVAMAPDSELAAGYREIARRAAARLSLQARDYSGSFPRIVVQGGQEGAPGGAPSGKIRKEG